MHKITKASIRIATLFTLAWDTGWIIGRLVDGNSSDYSYGINTTNTVFGSILCILNFACIMAIWAESMCRDINDAATVRESLLHRYGATNNDAITNEPDPLFVSAALP